MFSTRAQGVTHVQHMMHKHASAIAPPPPALPPNEPHALTGERNTGGSAVYDWKAAAGVGANSATASRARGASSTLLNSPLGGTPQSVPPAASPLAQRTSSRSCTPSPALGLKEVTWKSAGADSVRASSTASLLLLPPMGMGLLHASCCGGVRSALAAMSTAQLGELKFGQPGGAPSGDQPVSRCLRISNLIAVRMKSSMMELGRY